MRLLLWVSILGLACSSATADELYRWVDQAGKMHYSDIPATGMAGVKIIKLNSAPANDEAGLSYDTRRAKQNFPVTLYVAANCGDICQEARNLLLKRSVPFSEINLQTQAEFEAFKQLASSEGVPTLVVGKSWVKGFQSQQWHAELDAAGYPEVSKISE